jgi:hypothetical protein
MSRYNPSILTKVSNWIGSLVGLKTAAKTSVVAAINEHDDKLGNLSGLVNNISIDATKPPAPLVGIQANGQDQTQALQNIINQYDNVLVPAGQYIINGTILMNKNYKGKLHIGEGASLLKQSTAGNTDPVVWVCGYGQVLSGENMWSSSIISQVNSPYGVVCLGYKGMNDTVAKFMCYNSVKTLNLLGSGILTTGSPNILLYMASPEINGQPSYFHTVNEIIFRSSNIGLMLEGYANANNISDLHFYNVGTNKSLGGASIKFQSTNGRYPLENNINNVIQDGSSTDAYVLSFNGDSLGNVITNIIAEPGGNNSVFAYVLGTNHNQNVIIGYNNTIGGVGFDSTFLSKNTVIVGDEAYLNSVYPVTLNTQNFIMNNLYAQKTFQLGLLTENNAYQVATIPRADFNNRNYIVEMEVTITYNGSAIPGFINAAKASWLINKPYSGSTSITLASLASTSQTILVQPYDDGTNIVFGIHVYNNGSASTQAEATVNIKVLASSNGTAGVNYTPKITPVTNLTTIASPVIYNKATNMISYVGATAQRPTSATVAIGQPYFDTTLNKPIWLKSIAPDVWIDATGTTV